MSAILRSILVGLVAGCALAAGPRAARTQQPTLGVKGGAALTYWGGRDKDLIGRRASNGELGSKLGGTLGAFALFPVNDRITAQPEALLVRRGASEIGDDGSFSLLYLQVPILARVHIPVEDDRFRPFLLAGPWAALRLLCIESDDGDSGDCDGSSDLFPTGIDVDRGELGFVFAGGIEVPYAEGLLSIEVRYDHALTGLGETSGTVPIIQMQNRALSVILGYQFDR